MKENKTKRLVISAMFIAIGTAISLICEFIPFLNLPFGGTITIASTLPVIIIGYMYGTRWGLFSAFIYSILQIAIGTKTVAALFTPTSDSFMGIGIAISVVAIDYILAYTSLGLGGIFRNKCEKKKAIVCGVLVCLISSYFFHFLSGALFYGAWAEWFFTDTIIAELSISKYIMDSFTGFGLAAVYSLVYNGCYMIPEIIITALISLPISMIKQVEKRN